MRIVIAYPYEKFPAFCKDKEPPGDGRLPVALRLPIQVRGGLPQRLVGYYCQTSATPPLLMGWRINEARRSGNGIIQSLSRSIPYSRMPVNGYFFGRKYPAPALCAISILYENFSTVTLGVADILKQIIKEIKKPR